MFSVVSSVLVGRGVGVFVQGPFCYRQQTKLWEGNVFSRVFCSGQEGEWVSLYRALFVTASKRSCGKVMFSVVSSVLVGRGSGCLCTGPFLLPPANEVVGR